MSTFLSEKELVISAVDINDQPVALPDPIECDIVKSFDSPAISFEGIFPCGKAYPELYRLKAAVGSRILFEGTLDEQTVSDNDQGRRLKLLARSKGAVLLDNEAIPENYRNIRLTDIFRLHAKPYGFETLIYDGDPFYNYFQIDKGMSEWEVLSRFYYSTMLGNMMVDEDGSVLCKHEWPVKETHRFSNKEAGALRYSAVQIVNNRYSPISRFLIRSNETNLYSYVFNNSASNLRVVRRRCLIPSPEFNVSDGIGQLEAGLRVHQSMLGKLVVTVTVPGLLDARITDRANLDTGYETFTARFVHQVRHRLSAAGSSTTLTLLDPIFI